MANELDEINGPVNKEGRDINVIDKQLPVTMTTGDKVFDIMMWILIIPGLIMLYCKVKAKAYFSQLQQKIQANASRIDNYIEQRYEILKNVAGLVEKATTLDKETFSQIAALRSGVKNTENSDAVRNINASNLDSAFRSISVAVESYPQLQSMTVIADAMQQNSYLQKEITAARDLYNDSVSRWNQVIWEWPVKKFVAAKQGYTTRIPFSVSAEVKQLSKQKFF